MRNFALLNTIKITALLLGFLGALSLMRSLSRAFNWYATIVYGDLFNWGPVISILLLASCMGLLAYSIWQSSTPKAQLPHRRMDYSLLVLLCAAGFYVCVQMLQARLIQVNIPLQTAMVLLPVVSYGLAMLAFGELVTRLRDKTLVPSLYLYAFFKAYPIWQPAGFCAFLILSSQLFLLIYSPLPIKLLSISVVCAFTYFAAFTLNLSKEYDKANAEKIRTERFKSELITNVSHDIRTPLTSIINYVDLLKSEDLHGQASAYLQILDKKSTRLKILIDDLMEASKAGTGNIKIDIQQIDLGELVGQVAGEFENSFADKDLPLVIRQPDASITIRADSRHLYRTLENLFSNAAKYALKGTRVFAEITQKDGKTLFTLQNTAQNHLELSGHDVTEQFIRGDKSRQTEGSGLGLYIAKSLVELIGGKLHVSVLGDLFRVEIFFESAEM